MPFRPFLSSPKQDKNRRRLWSACSLPKCRIPTCQTVENYFAIHIVAARDEHAHAPRQVDAVDVDDLARLAGRLRHRPDVPEPRGAPPEGAPLARHIDLGVLGHEPRQEGPEVALVGVDRMRRGSTALPASPSLPTGLGPAVSLHGTAAHGASLALQLAPPRNRELFLNLSGTEQAKDRISDTLSVRAENAIDLTFQKKIRS